MEAFIKNEAGGAPCQLLGQTPAAPICG